MKQDEPTRQELIEENETLKERLWEAEQTIKAIRGGEVDAFVVLESGEEQVYTLKGADVAYRILVESLNEGAFIVASDDSIFYCNSCFSAMVGLPIQKIIGSHIRSFFIPDSQKPVADKVRKTREAGVARGEFILERSDGTFLPVSLSLNFITKKDFEVVCAIVTDLSWQKQVEEELRRHRTELECLVTERTADLARTNAELQQEIIDRKRMEEALLEARDKLELRVLERTAELSGNERKYKKLSQEFQTLLNAISDTLILLSPEMEILWTNRGNALELNETASDPVVQYCYKLLHDRSTPSEDCPITKCFDTAEKEVSVVTHNGAVLDIRAFPIKEAERVSSVLLLVSDITEKMAMQAEAMQAGHMASLGELAAGVAHEINNPITGIINYGQILVNECGPERMEKDIGERIVKEGERIGRIVKTLLSYARDGRKEKKPTRVSVILEESIILTQAQIQKEGIDLKIDIPEGLAEVDANFQQIQQGFINIINNARYALNEKYPGRHKNKRFEITGEQVIISGCMYVRIVFYDQGVGIPAHQLSMLTRPFFSTKPFGKGTGLGLNITQRIITDHGGQISFESTKGEFTRVIIDLPANRSCDGVENECENSCNR
ncbi:MAG: PAS domain-containing protein [Syntrophobacteraceae bacterium]